MRIVHIFCALLAFVGTAAGDVKLPLIVAPTGALAFYPKARRIQRISLNPKFSRELVVVVRKDRKPPEHLTQFVDSILF